MELPFPVMGRPLGKQDWGRGGRELSLGCVELGTLLTSKWRDLVGRWIFENEKPGLEIQL